MTIEDIRSYCLAKELVTEGFPFDKFDKDILVFKVNGKMFLLTSLKSWEEGKQSVNLKCDPEWAQELRSSYDSVIAGFHMSKKHWNTISLHTNELSPEFVFKLIDHSYRMVILGMSKKDQALFKSL